MKISSRIILRLLNCFFVALIIFTGCAAERRQSADHKIEHLYADCDRQGRFTPIYNRIYIESDIPYLGPDRREKFDLYSPADPNEDKRFPAVVIIHGGGWRGGDKDRDREKNIAINLARSGYVCMSINYLLIEEGKPAWPENLYDCKRAVQFLRKNAERFKVVPDRIGVIGGSAGGHLAAMLALTGPEARLEPPGPYKGLSSRVQAAVPLYGIHNLVTFDKEDTPRRCEKLLGVSKEEGLGLWALASPVNHVSADDPPFLIIHGTADKIVHHSQSIELHEMLRQGSVSTRLVLLKDAPHTFHLQPPRCDIRPLVVGFFDKHLKNKTRD